MPLHDTGAEQRHAQQQPQPRTKSGDASPPSLMALAVRCLSQRDYSRQELRERLMRRRMTAGRTAAPAHDLPNEAVDAADATEAAAARSAALHAEIEAVLDRLQAMAYLDDGRLAQATAAVRSARHGLRRIRQDLAQRGVALDTAHAAALRDTEAERAQALWQRRFGQAPGTPREWQRQTRFLLARGFEADVVRRVVGGIARRDAADPSDGDPADADAPPD